jgi:hypothetical protein
VRELSFVRSQISATGLHSLLDLLAGRPVLGSFFHMYQFFLACSLSAVPPGPVPKRLPCPFSFFWLFPCWCRPMVLSPGICSPFLDEAFFPRDKADVAFPCPRPAFSVQCAHRNAPLELALLPPRVRFSHKARR